MNDDVSYTCTQTRRYTKENKKKLDILFFLFLYSRIFSIGLNISTILKIIFFKKIYLENKSIY
jgi:hypothetical protein